MSTSAIIILIVISLAAFLIAAMMLAAPKGGGGLGGRYRSNLSGMVSAQREGDGLSSSRKDKNSIWDAAPQVKTSDSRLTLKKRLKFAQWKISPAAFRLLEVSMSIFAFFIAGIKLNMMMQIMALGSGPLFMRWLLNFFVNRRFKAFDQDYSPFLLSLIGLLKTGMNPMAALEAAAQGLEEGSLVREEVELMMERLRFGVSEDKSIGAFGEDVFHQEIELFVQALLLSRRVGGTLSDTLDRLARQVRRRQYFRNSAVAAVGMQRGSIWFIIGILVALEVYLFIVYPESITGAWENDIGWQVWQAGIAMILMGIYWVRQVTKMKV
jgi:tight adherence protein B